MRTKKTKKRSSRPRKRKTRPRPVTKEKPFSCFGYARVSTIKQIEAPGGLKAQTDKIKKFCKDQGHQLTTLFIDKGVSAIDERPEFEKMMQAVKKGKAQAVIVTRLDRLGRSVLDLVATVSTLQKHHCQFIALEQNLNTTTTEGRLLFNILSAFAEFEREIIKERMLAGRERAREQGKLDHRPKLPIPLDELKDLYFDRKMSVMACAKYFRCSRGTIYARLKEIQPKQ